MRAFECFLQKRPGPKEGLSCSWAVPRGLSGSSPWGPEPSLFQQQKGPFFPLQHLSDITCLTPSFIPGREALPSLPTQPCYAGHSNQPEVGEPVSRVENWSWCHPDHSTFLLPEAASSDTLLGHRLRAWLWLAYLLGENWMGGGWESRHRSQSQGGCSLSVCHLGMQQCRFLVLQCPLHRSGVPVAPA